LQRNLEQEKIIEDLRSALEQYKPESSDSRSHTNSACQQSRSDSFTERTLSPPAGVTRLSRSRSLPNTKRQTDTTQQTDADSQRDVILLQLRLDDALRKLANTRLALRAKVSPNI